ncbi:phage Gp37/Gp68 family protein [Ancylobacter sp.]|uniref:phage Gp37/Gp68 family protein n=1 Tax=Ancylobacter sp. TaxID=1872567 RepID=UPI003D0B27AD
MADHTGIEWADATWNPIVGCSIVSPGCTNCYAMKQAARIERMQPGSHYAGTTLSLTAGAVWSGEFALAPDHILTQPLHWRRPRRIFVNSMGDLFHEDVPDHWIDRVFAIMALAPQHTFMVLTKRSARMRQYLVEDRRHWRCMSVDGLFPQRTDASRQARDRLARLTAPGVPAPLENVWLGVSTEDQRRANERVPDLLATPAAIRFVSAEPLLGPIDLTRVGDLSTVRAAMPSIVAREEQGRPVTGRGSVSGFQVEAIGSRHSSIEYFQTPDHMGGFSAASPRRFPRLDLVIAGGESGPKARPVHPDWARSLRDQCAAAGTAFFFKQWGEWAPEEHLSIEQAAKTYESDLHAGRTWRFTGQPMRRLGKHHSAGRLLDGVEHNAMPEVRP